MPWQIARPVSALRAQIGLDAREMNSPWQMGWWSCYSQTSGGEPGSTGRRSVAPVQAQEARESSSERSSWQFIPMTRQRLALGSQSQHRPQARITWGSFKTSWRLGLTPGDADVTGLRWILGIGVFKAPQMILIAAKFESHCFREMGKGICKRIFFLLCCRFPLLSVSIVPEIAPGNCWPLLHTLLSGLLALDLSPLLPVGSEDHQHRPHPRAG